MLRSSALFLIVPFIVPLAACSKESGGGGAGGAATVVDASPQSVGNSTANATATSSTVSSAKSGSVTTAATTSSTTAASSSATGGPPPGGKRVFVTHATYTGNLMMQGNGTDGLDGGDKLCQLASQAAVLGGNWTAWLSSDTVDAIDRIGDVGPWYRLDGAKVFNNKASIVTSGPLVAIDIDETGGTPMVDTWTGTKDNGMADDFTCHNWTNDDQFNGYEGAVGVTVGVQFWTIAASNPCHLSNTLYCFEQ